MVFCWTIKIFILHRFFFFFIYSRSLHRSDHGQYEYVVCIAKYLNGNPTQCLSVSQSGEVSIVKRLESWDFGESVSAHKHIYTYVHE